MFARLSRFVVAHPWPVIAAWLVAVALIVPLSPGLDDVTNEDQTSFLPSSYESVEAQELGERAFPEQSGSSALFVVTRRDGGALGTQERAQVTRFARELRSSALDRVNGVVTGRELLSPDRQVQLVRVAIVGLAFEDPVAEAIERLRDRGDELLADSELQAQLSGDAAILKDTRDSYRDAEGIVGIATIVLILILLGAIFRSPLAALLPIVTIGAVFAAATSLVALVADLVGFEVGSEVTSLLIVVLFGIGTDYILFLLFRHRERLRAGEPPARAIEFALSRVGRVVASAALVVIATFLALLLSRFESFQALAPALVISVAVMLAAALTLVPAVIALLGARLFWPSRSWRHAPQATISKRIGRAIAARPAPVALASGGLLVALAVGVLFYEANYNSLDRLPDDVESAEAFETLDASFPAGALNPTEVYVEGEAVTPAELAQLRRELRQVDGVSQVGPPEPSPAENVTRLTVSIEESPFSNTALDLVEGPLRAVAHGSIDDGRVLVGGQTAAFADVRSAINRDYTVVYPVAAALILLILVVLLRSAVAPLYLLAAVALGFAATLGASVAVFQGLAGEVGLSFATPLILYLFVVAIGTDYNILMTARLREEYQEGLDARRAADMSVEHAGPTIAAAGVILAGTFASLILTGIGPLVEMGFSVSVGILIVAFVMASALVPSVSALLGRRIWWPGHEGDSRQRTAERDEVAPPAPAGSSRDGRPAAARSAERSPKG
jgi:putative drug exporter of the RND superfamily